MPTLLLCEDDPVSQSLILHGIEGLFEQVYQAGDGHDGFHCFCIQQPDLVISDQMMPGCSGLELIRQIRATGAQTPVVMITCCLDQQFLIEALNVGVERFIPKPIDLGLLRQTVSALLRDMERELFMERHVRQEVELLRYREAYHALQEEAARQKERHVIRHDDQGRLLAGARGGNWVVDAWHAPRDILCGDSYSVRRLHDGRLLVILVDAMGSGLAASLSAMMTVSFCNYQVGYVHQWATFSLEGFVGRVREFLAGMLLESEVLSCGFLLVDLPGERVEMALFGLPPLLVKGLDDSVRRVRGLNPPLGCYSRDIRTDTLSLAGVAELLVMTDGLLDAPLREGGSYRQELEQDFRSVTDLYQFKQLFRERTVAGIMDDLTLLRLGRQDVVTDGGGWGVQETGTTAVVTG
jgi:DNA-binding response OmpR family regulator